MTHIGLKLGHESTIQVHQLENNLKYIKMSLKLMKYKHTFHLLLALKS